MIIQCNSCEKSFTVPDNAITVKGRLVQCSSCGNKWTQYPIKEKEETKTISKPNVALKSNVRKKKKKKKKKIIDAYSPEYLNKKHGIKIINPSSLQVKINKKKEKNKGFGFYNYLITFIIFFVTFYGILNLTREIILFNYPFMETYMNYFFETIYNIKLIFSDIISNY